MALRLAVPAVLAAISTPLAASSDLMSAEQRAWLVAAGRDGSGPAAASAVVGGEGAGTAVAFPPMTAAQASQLFAAEEAFYDTYYSYHQAWDQYANPHYKSKTDRSATLEWDELGDSACWSGHQLAALAHRFNATGDKTTLGRINDSLGAFENLTQVAGKPGFMARFLGKVRFTAVLLLFYGCFATDFGPLPRQG